MFFKSHDSFKKMGISRTFERYCFNTVYNYFISLGRRFNYLQYIMYFRENFAHNGMQFSTPDKDNDKSTSNCAQQYKSAFWFNNCYSADPNGVYYNNGQYNGDVSNS